MMQMREWRGMGMTADDQRAVFGDGVWIWRWFWNDIVVIVTQVCEYNKIGQILCFK